LIVPFQAGRFTVRQFALPQPIIKDCPGQSWKFHALVAE